ncbi:sensor histidine kinase [Streptomyces sp. ISL-22]|uniref:sensor histidine kinase n=1 Tax=unclassified Streptomyces TaxID=2593676 RepID=UPI001BE9D3FC|nr:MULTISPECIES: sensor histidine kinase [unclassified Streptomyces]MBT2420706.1 sensor histidine kinase [Streptomyces sp. ISL-24]MBT2434829.1 sensor histidine kinase [Streptomyces sp. ISL-22]
MKPKRQCHLHALDLGAALALTAVYIGFARLTADDGQPVYTGPFWLGCLIAATVGLPIAVRRRWPLAVLVTVLAALATASLLDIPREPYAAAGLAAYLVGVAEPARRSVPALAVTLPVACGAVLLGEAVVTPAEDWPGAVGVAGLVLLVIGGAWGVGFTVRGRRAESAREQRRRAERALDEERLRIARELHDIVSHNLSLIAIKAGVAGHVAEADPREARAALKVIEETSRSALAEMRRTLGVLRTEGALLGPAPGLDRLDSLAAEANRAGVEVDLTVHATKGLAEGTQLTIYRIVQESLTNAVRHAAPTRCQVTVETNEREIRVDIADEGPPSAAGRPVRELPGGHGLLGIRERAMMYGGSFQAGPRPEGGFAVSVRLPAEGNQRP